MIETIKIDTATLQSGDKYNVIESPTNHKYNESITKQNEEIDRRNSLYTEAYQNMSNYYVK